MEAFGGHLARLGQELGIQTRTVRLTLPVAPSGGEGHQPGALSSVMDGVRDLADVLGARWYCLPLDLLRPGAHGAVLDEAQTLVLRDSRLFVNLIAADPDVISIEGAHSASRFILSLARRGNTGIDNFRVGVSAACPAGTPFFPFSRHEGDEPGFSLALETASLALQCAERARAEQGSLLEFQERLIEALAAEMRRVDAFGRVLEEASGVEYRGLDGSLAPFPDGVTSIGRLVELLGPSPVGAHGTIFITSVLSDAIKTACVRAQARTVGFNGVMYSLLEDNGLAGANNLRAVTIEKLAVFSTVCGCGIDMVPVPGTMFAEDLAGIGSPENPAGVDDLDAGQGTDARIHILSCRLSLADRSVTHGPRAASGLRIPDRFPRARPSLVRAAARASLDPAPGSGRCPGDPQMRIPSPPGPPPARGRD
ncbi:MAG: DUF711 family protein, partial [Burkholderiales bacterium]|nr:DUF711 family protein [Burkholderiales bacterium]